jgi:hypothetical protein
MAIQYPAGSRLNATFAGDTKALIRDGIETNLLAAGWTTVSGSGSADLIMQSGLTPQNLQIRARFRDTGIASLRGSIQDVAGSFVGTVDGPGNSGCHLQPAAGRIYRIVANQYQFFVFTAPVTLNGQYIAGGVPYLPPHLAGIINQAAWMHSNAQHVTDIAGPNESFRATLCVKNGYQYTFVNTNFWQAQGSLNAIGQHAMQAHYSPYGSASAYRWHDDSAFVYDALISWGLTGLGDEGKVRGQLWDAFLATESYTGDVTTSYDGHNWIVLTHNNTASVARGSIFLCIP